MLSQLISAFFHGKKPRAFRPEAGASFLCSQLGLDLDNGWALHC